MWPAVALGDVTKRRAERERAPHPLTHLVYPDAGHMVAGVPGIPVVIATPAHPLDGLPYAFGGTRAANAASRADSWPRIVDFLHTALARPESPRPLDAVG